jgi:predicted O-methyltransferase YrrM
VHKRLSATSVRQKFYEYHYPFLEKGARSDMPWYGSHSFLNEYISKNNCKRIMEIGVLDGNNAKSMVEIAIQNSPPDEVEYYGFDLFADYNSRQVAQKLEKTGCKFKLFEGDTVDTLPKAVKILPKMDLIFIDGGKSFAEAKSDWENSKSLMHDGTAVFVHNYEFSGVRRMVDTIPQDKYNVRIIHTSSEGEIALIEKTSESL